MKSISKRFPSVVLLLLFFSLFNSLQAQMRVGQPAGTPDPSAALDVSGGPYANGSQYRGIAPPKVVLKSSSQAAPITKPVTGLLIYNTEATADVIPGYYYWEGSKWVRFSTVPGAGSARVAAGGGQSIPAFLLTDLPTLTAPYPDNFILVDRDKEGIFSYDPNDTTTPSDNAMVLVSGSRRYKRVIDGAVNVKWFGAKGNIVPAYSPSSAVLTAASAAELTANTQAIQAAIDYVGSAIDGAQFTSPKSKGRPNSLYIPSGTWMTNSTLKVRSPILIFGDGGTSFGGTKIANVVPNVDLFWLTGEYQNGSLATQIQDIKVACYQNSTNATTFYVPSTGSINSIYFYRVWFQGTDKEYLRIDSGDDLKIVDCSFDGFQNYAFTIGSDTRTVTNVLFSNNGFYCSGASDQHKPPLGVGTLKNVDGFTFIGNRAFGDPNDNAPVPFFLDASSGKAKNVQIVGNKFSRINNIYIDTKGGFIFNNNICSEMTGPMLNFGSTGVYTISNVVAVGNHASGIWNNTLNVNQSGIISPLAPIWAHANGNIGATLTNTIITNNLFVDNTNTSLTGLYAPHGNNSGNTFDNKFVGFATPNQVGGAPSQVVNQSQYLTITAQAVTDAAQNSAIAGKQATLTNTSSVTVNQIQTVNGQTSVQSLSMVMSTPSWSSTAYTSLFEAGSLPLDMVYELTVYATGGPGVEVATQVYRFAVVNMNNQHANPADLTPLSVQQSSGTTSRAIEVRLRKPQDPHVLGPVGLEARLATGETYLNKTLTVSLIPLYKIPH